MLWPAFSYLAVPASLLAKEPSAKAMAMTTEEVIQWLHSIKLSKYAEIFKENEVDGELLASCSVQDVKEIGVGSALDQKKIYLRFRRI